MSDRPNILFFITDQQRADWLGCYGHPVLQTPNIDGIAEQGMRFDDFYVASPVCMPNRASLMTGRYPSLHGLRYNGCCLPAHATTFVDVLAGHGYRTASIGKSHLQPFTGIDAEPRVDRDELGRLDEAVRFEMPFFAEEQAHLARGNEQVAFPTPYYGFQSVDMLTAHGFKSGGHYTQWLLAQSPDGLSLLDPKNQLKHNYSCPQAVRLPIPEALYTTSYVKEKALDFLHKTEASDTPFFAFVSFNDPHHPFNPPGKYWDMYNPDDFPVPPDYEELINPIEPLQRVRTDYLAGLPPKTMETVFMATPHQIQEAMALTAGLITMIDDAIGDILEKLKETGKFDNTIIIFTSDHGDFLGDHSLMLKGAIPYRGVTRVPFIWSDPKDRRKSSCDALTSTLDVSASLIERVGAKPYWGMQGQSLCPLLNGEAESRDQYLIEYEDGMSRFGFDEPAFVRSLLTRTHRLTLYRGQDFGELYDLEHDPLEQHNLFTDAGFTSLKAELTERLLQEMMQSAESSPRASRRA